MTKDTPHAIDVERAILGSILRHHDLMTDLVGDLTGCWWSPEHARLYGLLRTMADRGEAPDATLVGEYVYRDKPERYGGVGYVHSLTTHACTRSACASFSRMLRRLHRSRAALAHIEEATRELHAVQPGAVERLIASLEGVADMGGTPTEALGLEGVGSRVADVVTDPAGEVTALSTGYRALDALLVGLEPGNLYMVGGRPRMGKSVLGLGIGLNMARDGWPVAYCSLEMGREQLVRRMLSSMSGVHLWRLRKRQYDPKYDDEAKIIAAGEEVDRLPIGINDRPDQDMAACEAHAAAVKRKHGALGLLVIDHMHRMPETNDKDIIGALGRVAKGAKNAAKRLECPVLLLAQLNRAADKERPSMAHLRDSGLIETEADYIGLISNPGAIDPHHPHADRLELITGKQRDGGNASVWLGWDGPCVRVTDLDEHDPESTYGGHGW